MHDVLDACPTEAPTVPPTLAPTASPPSTPTASPTRFRLRQTRWLLGERARLSVLLRHCFGPWPLALANVPTCVGRNGGEMALPSLAVATVDVGSSAAGLWRGRALVLRTLARLRPQFSAWYPLMVCRGRRTRLLPRRRRRRRRNLRLHRRASLIRWLRVVMNDFSHMYLLADLC